ncbi:MAG: spoIIIJ-associated protein [Thermoleophilaceae bacterium]|nr:spoIIIJ-associated protein [Thermoleophilaceae bacterium]
MSQEPARIEAEGATLGEAKWAAVKALEPTFPGITSEFVTFEVLEEAGDEVDARVVAQVDVVAWEGAQEAFPDEPAERVRQMVGRVTLALGLRSSVDVVETADEIRATVNGEDLGILIGRHGSTIDALQHLASRIAFRGHEERKLVVVDAAGYRERREAALRRMADDAVTDALSFGRPVELEPMGAHERKVVHRYLTDRTDIQTHSEGDEPDRRLVVSPLAAAN